MAEAFFDLANYDQAGDWLQKAAALPDIPTWELETTARQLASLARIQLQDDLPKAGSGAWDALEKF
jgi:hypothetical protein